MKNKTLATIFLILTLSFQVFAETPSEAVNAVHNKIRATGSLAPMIDMFDFDAAYDELPAEDRQQVSKAQFVTVAKGAMQNPAQMMASMLPPEVQPMAAQIVGQFKAELEDTLKNTQTKVVDEQIDGDNALLTIESNYKGDIRQDKFKMKKSDGKWKFVYSEIIDSMIDQVR